MGRHRKEDTHKPYQIEQLWSIHHEITRLSLIGMKQIDIAKHLNVSPVMVSYTLRSPLVTRQLDQMKSVRDMEAIDISTEIKNLAPKAVAVLEELMDNDLPNVKLSAAKDILDRAGYAATKTIRTENIHAHFSADEISEIKQNARDIGLLIDADYMVEAQEATG